MLVAYLDDSGTDDQSEVAALAGYIATDTAWAAFEGDWNGLLSREGLPFYHAAECAAGGGLYKGWKNERRGRIHREAVDLITAHPLVAVGYSVSAPLLRRRHAEWVRKRPDGARMPKIGYLHCFAQILLVLANHMRRVQPGEKLAIRLEQTPEVTAWIMECFEGSVEEGALRSFASYFSGAPEFRPKLGYPQLQAADVLAWEFTLDAKRHFNRQQVYRRRASWRALVEHQERNLGFLAYMDSPLASHDRWIV